MGAEIQAITSRQRSVDEDRHRLESEAILDAIAAAIAAGRLPPDDAYAWARIAAYEVNRECGVDDVAA